METPTLPSSRVTHSLDLGWFRHHLTQELLPLWLQHAVTDQGFFCTHFDRQWRRGPSERNTLVAQTRLLYNFAVGHQLTGLPEYQHAVQAGTHFLLEAYWDHELGGWYRACALDGSVVDSSKDSYGQAFALLGLAHAYKCTGDQDLRQAAWDTWQVLNTHFKDRHGGLIPTVTRDFEDCGHIRSQNPIMHLFEALLAWGSLKGESDVLEEAEKTADFVLTHLLRKANGLLPEWYTLDWSQLPEEQGGHIDIGHAFEWSFLLSTAVESGLPEAYLSHATNFLEYGLRIGYDGEEGGVFRLSSLDGSVLSRDKRWWPQCEAIRALMHFVVLRAENQFRPPLLRTIQFVKEHFIDDEYGGWYTFREPLKSVEDQEDGTDKGGDWKVDYHVVGMCLEAIRLQPA